MVENISLSEISEKFYTPNTSINSDIPPPLPLQESESTLTPPMRLDSPSLPSPIDTILQCSRCPNIYTTNNKLVDHLSRHSTNKLWSCDSCDFTFHTRKALGEHSVTAHHHKLAGEKKITHPIHASTPLIGKSKRKYVRKANEEQVAKEFACDKCTRSFNSNRALNIHKHAHKN